MPFSRGSSQPEDQTQISCIAGSCFTICATREALSTTMFLFSYYVLTRIGKIPWRRERLPTPVCWPGEFHGLYNPWGHKDSDTTERLSLLASVAAQTVKNPPAMQETRVRSLGLGRSPGGGHGNPLQYSGLENTMDRGAWWATVHRVSNSQT